MGGSAYTYAASLSYTPEECIVEVGSERGEGSTAYLAFLASECGVPFFSIDVDPDAAERARSIGGVQVLLGYAEDHLANWDGPPVRFAWIDGHDWPYSWCARETWFKDQQARYAARGDTVTEEASMASHLVIARLIDPLTRSGTVVMFDDTWRDRNRRRGEGRWRGKGGTAVPYLIKTGAWRLTGCVNGTEPDDGFARLEKM